MKLVLVNLYPTTTLGRYLLSSYVLKAYVEQALADADDLTIDVQNHPAGAPVERIAQAICAAQPTCVGYSCYTWNVNPILKLINTIRERTATLQIVGGPEVSPTMITRTAPTARADYYIIGAGERPLAELLHHLITGQPTDLPSGLTRWQADKLQSTGPAEPITDLSEIPSVYLTDTLERPLYARQQAFIETQRGCRFRCKYCVYHKQNAAISYYPLPRILAELEHLIINAQVQAIRIFDAIFPSDLGRAKEIIRFLIRLRDERHLRLPWLYWEFNHHQVDDEFLQLVSQLKTRPNILNTADTAPLDRPQHYSELLRDYTAINSVGLQSLNPAATRTVSRAPIRPAALLDFLQRARQHNIVLKLDLILGMPRETFDSYFAGLELLLPLLANTDHVLNIHRLQILPGSDLEAICEPNGIVYTSAAPHLVTQTADLSETELKIAGRLTAILFRIVNSPLRAQFFTAWHAADLSLPGLLDELSDRIAEETAGQTLQLFSETGVDDDYWNGPAYEELGSGLIQNILSEISQQVIQPCPGSS